MATVPAEAHVDYVAENRGESVDPAQFLSTVLTDPGNLLLLGTGGAVAAGGLVGYLYLYQTAPRDIAILREELTEFAEFLPWLLRLSIGLPLVGAGRPSVDVLLSRLASTDDTVYGGLEFTGRLTERAERVLGPYRPYTPPVLRVGAGLSFLFVGLADKLLQPGKALVVVEQYQLTSVLPIDPGLWVVGAGGTEVVLGLALIVGFFTRGVATAAFGILTLTLFALPDDPVLAHIPLFGLAAALLITGSGRLALDNV